MKNPYIFNIQKFSVHDGPGIRTTVFFKGCPLHCLWCHNPESQKPGQEWMLKKAASDEAAELTGKAEIDEAAKMAGTMEKTEIDEVAENVKTIELAKIAELVGKQYSVTELVKLLKKDQIFYDQSGGGVTLSGGEVMVQDMDYILALLQALDRQGISVVIDTCGCAPTERFEKVLPYTELFLYDLKMINDEKHQKYTGVSNELILKNLKYLSDRKARIELRMIMVRGVNMEDEDIVRTLEWLKKEAIKVEKIALLPYHDFGRDKYRKLSRECTQNFEKPGEEHLLHVKEMLESGGYIVDIHS